MKVAAGLIHILLAIYMVNGAHARACDILQSSIICSGPAIDDLSLGVLRQMLRTRYKDFYFLQVMITETSITKIPESTFADITFENLVIDGNQLLTLIDEKAFAEQSIKTLYIISNPALSTNGLYALTNRLHVTEAIDFDFNSLKEVPSFAFHETPFELNDAWAGPRTMTFQKLVLSNNKITQIATYAFEGLAQCTEIDLNENQINLIQSNAFNLTSLASAKVISINLAKNHLNSSSFDLDFVLVNPSQPLSINLSGNQITELKQELFEPLLKGNTIIDLSGNQIDCSTVHWLTGNQKYLSKIKGIHC